jgi:Rieske Fe-S protein
MAGRGYQAGRVYGNGGRTPEYDQSWERQPGYADGGWDGYRGGGDYGGYGDRPDPGDSGWSYDDSPGYDDRGYEDTRRPARRPRPRPRPEPEPVELEFGSLPIVNRGGRRRQLILAGLLGSAVALVGERVARLFGNGGGAANAATNPGTQTGTTGTAGTKAPTQNAAGTQTGTGGAVLANTADIPVGSAKIFAEQKVVITQPSAGTFKAYSTVCTHAGCLLDQVKADKIYCPCHPGVYNLDGSVASGPPPSPLAPKQINVSGDQITL